MTSRRKSKPDTSDRVWAVILSMSACVGLAGTLAVRTGQEQQAQAVEADDGVANLAIVAQKTAELASYSAALDARAAKLDQYQAMLTAAAAEIAGRAASGPAVQLVRSETPTTSLVTSPSPAALPERTTPPPKPSVRPAETKTAPQATTKSS